MTLSPSSSDKSLVLDFLPPDVDNWDVDDVSKFFRSNLKPSRSTEEAEVEKSLEIDKIKEHGINGFALLDLSRESLARIGICQEGRVLNVLKVIKKLKEAMADVEEASLETRLGISLGPSKRRKVEDERARHDDSDLGRKVEKLRCLYNLLWRDCCDVYRQISYEGPEVIEDDEGNTEHISPVTFQGIDLGPNAAVPTFKLNSLLIRPEYNSMIETITNTATSFAILGGPGIGKTCALSVILVKRLAAKLPTTYHPDGKEVYSFTKDGFHLLDSLFHPVYDDEDAWHLVDSNEHLTTIPSILRRAVGKIVQAASPKQSRHREWVKQASATIWWMSPPTWTELYVTAVQLTQDQNPPADISDLVHVFWKYGPNTRLCMALWGNSERVTVHEADIDSALSKLPKTTDWLPDPSDLGVSSALFSLTPEPGNIIAFPRPTSRYIANRLVARGLRLGAQRVLDMFEILSANPVTRSAAGHMFEPLALAMLQLVGGSYTLQPFPQTGLKIRSTTLSNFTLKPGERFGSDNLFTNSIELKELCKKHPGELLIPSQKTYPSIDACLH